MASQPLHYTIAAIRQFVCNSTYALPTRYGELATRHNIMREYESRQLHGVVTAPATSRENISHITLMAVNSGYDSTHHHGIHGRYWMRAR